MSTITALLASSGSVGVWTLVPERSTIGFKAKSMWGLLPVNGRFTEFSGDGQITETQTVFGRVDIKAASLDTKLRKRDEDLRKPEFFDVQAYPEINVVVTGTEGVGGDTIDLRANLTVKTATAPLPLRATVSVLDDGAVRVLAQASVDRRDFKVEGNLLGMVGDMVTLSGDLVFRRAAG